MKVLLLIAILSMPFLWISCEAIEGATPIPRDKERYVGMWESKSGFTIEIKASGLADIMHDLSQGDPDYEQLWIKVGPKVRGELARGREANGICEGLYGRTATA